MRRLTDSVIKSVPYFGCRSYCGIASAFNAPIAGIMFAFEILLTGVVFTDFIPLVVAAVCGSLLSRILLQEDVLFRFYTREAFNYKNVPYYLILGL
jgi:CIC family chloride channel protein